MKLCAWLSRSLPVRIVSCSERAREFHVAQGYAGDKMLVIPNGFDLSAFAPLPAARAEVRRELGIPPQAPVVGMVARYHAAKDFGTFAAAAGRLLRDLPDAWFALCGDGVTADNAELRALLGAAGALERCRLLGRRTDVARLQSALDVFTLSSVTEGFPNSLGEAMACGVPCVTTDAGDCGWILGNPELVVARRDPEALAAAWRRVLLLDPGARRALGDAGRSRIAGTFAIESVAARYLELYRSSMGARHLARAGGAGSRPDQAR
jgi:glycosyltransferase involved in cell wall biosynthesis